MAKPEDIIEVIVKSFELDIAGEEYSSTWKSPKWFLPLQSIRDSGGVGSMGLDGYQFSNLLRKEGYRYDCPIEVVQVDGYYYIIEGHHRNCSMAYIGKTLVPYEVIARDDEIIPGKTESAREWVYRYLEMGGRYRLMLYDHESAVYPKVETGDGKTREYWYTDLYGTYPEIPEKYLKENTGKNTNSEER